MNWRADAERRAARPLRMRGRDAWRRCGRTRSALPRQSRQQRAAHGDKRIDHFGACATSGYLTIHIDDDGPGIPADKREDVFRPFHRLDEARNQDQAGSGLGLAIARDIARAHGGDVTAGGFAARRAAGDGENVPV
jgi:two-component system osmolarity sensor histidine kinase EnvZ